MRRNTYALPLTLLERAERRLPESRLSMRPLKFSSEAYWFLWLMRCSRMRSSSSSFFCEWSRPMPRACAISLSSALRFCLRLPLYGVDDILKIRSSMMIERRVRTNTEWWRKRRPFSRGWMEGQKGESGGWILYHRCVAQKKNGGWVDGCMCECARCRLWRRGSQRDWLSRRAFSLSRVQLCISFKLDVQKGLVVFPNRHRIGVTALFSFFLSLFGNHISTPTLPFRHTP